jgi:esterase/lipase superfamily enzyme
MLVATTRRPSENPAVRFSGERTLKLSFARLAVSIPENRQVGEVIWPTGGKPDPKNTFAATRFETIPADDVKRALRGTIARNGRRHVLLFVHGYNTRFDEAAFRLAQIVHDSGSPVTPVLFSWPSWGSLAAYPYDRESAAVSRDGLERVLTELAQNPVVSQVSVLAHSMGGWLTLETFRQMAIRNGRIFPKITDVMLAAPDVDVDVAATQARALRDAASKPRVTLFVSGDDRALGASRLFWGSRDRLGSLDVNKEPYRTNLKGSGLEVIDLTAASGGSGGDALHHGKFASSPAVVRLIGGRLASGQEFGGGSDIREQSGAFLQGTVRVIGDVVTAPLRISNPSRPDGEGASGSLD